MTPNNEQPNIALYGPISPEEAAQLTAATNPNTDPLVQAIRTRIGMQAGDMIGEQQLSLGLVVEKDEQGVDQPVQYLDLGNYDLGTKVNRAEDDTKKGKQGLPELSMALEILEARAATIKEGGTKKELSNFDAIATDPNTILQPVNLEFFAKSGNVYDAIAEADEAGNHQERELISEIANSAARTVFGPELSVQQTKVMTQQMAANMYDELRMLDNTYTELRQDNNVASNAVSALSARVPELTNLLNNVASTLRDGGKLDDYDYQRLAAIQEFAYGYRDALRQIEHTDERGQEAAMRTQHTTDNLREDVNSQRGRIAYEAEEAMFPAANADYSETVEAVIKRGAATISDHYNACEEEKTALQNNATELVTQLDAVNEINRQVMIQMYNRQEIMNDNAIHPVNVETTLEYATRYIQGHFSGGQYGADSVIQAIGESMDVLQKLSAVIQKRDQATNDVQQVLQQADTAAQALKQLSIFETVDR